MAVLHAGDAAIFVQAIEHGRELATLLVSLGKHLELRRSIFDA